VDGKLSLSIKVKSWKKKQMELKIRRQLILSGRGVGLFLIMMDN
jgi:hypothetical protein